MSEHERDDALENHKARVLQILEQTGYIHRRRALISYLRRLAKYGLKKMLPETALAAHLQPESPVSPPPCSPPTLSPKWIRIVREPLMLNEHRALQETGGKVRNPTDVAALLRTRAERELQEVLWVILLGSQARVLDLQEVTRGIVNSTLAHPREVFRAAILGNATALIVAHNHPSGDPTPSKDDFAATKQLVEAGRLLDMPVHDHMIVTHRQYYSFAEAGQL